MTSERVAGTRENERTECSRAADIIMKLLFFGTSDFSKPVFEALKKEGYSPILWNLENSFDDFKKVKPDICIVAAYGKIIPKEYLPETFWENHFSFYPPDFSAMKIKKIPFFITPR